MIGRKGTKLGALLLLVCLLCACGKMRTSDKTVVVLREAPIPTATQTPPQPSASAPPAPAVSRTADWYGWWRMFNCSGDWSHMYGYYWDCCAEIREEDESLRLQLWDEDVSRYVGLASARLREDNGVLKCTAGGFLDRELRPADWTITATEDTCGKLLHIEGKYEAVGKGGFQYEIFLRPWGSRWPGDEDERPYYYESWYLPLVEGGAKMPDEIGKGT